MAQNNSDIKYLTPIAVETKKKNIAVSEKAESNTLIIKMLISF